ncbi:MAG: hypothetical protein Q9M26_01110 [Mariprofundales bacterium]|nr:hypothetical protein [Mariprofundales bacterium]
MEPPCPPSHPKNALEVGLPRIYPEFCKRLIRLLLGVLALLLPCVLAVPPALAHHVMGRPSYKLNEDSNTPPSMQVETQIGNYSVTYMVFPAFPRPNAFGRINLYAVRIDNGKPFQGKVRFLVRDDSWFRSSEEVIGEQPVDDNVFRQGFIFRHAGDYIITASFEADGQPYTIDFPLRIGQPSRIGIIGIVVGFIIVLLLVVNITQRRRLLNAKVREAQIKRHE